MDKLEKRAEESRQIGKEQNPDLSLRMAVDLRQKLSTTEKGWVRKRQKTAQNAKMLREKPCPLSKERNESVHIRNCRESGTTCSDVKWLFAWKECPIFLSSRKTRGKVNHE